VILGVIIGGTHRGISTGRFDTAHEKADCSGCHTFVASTGSENFEPVNRSERCAGCHADVSGSSSLGFHGDGRECLECHSYHETGNILASDRQFHFDFNSDRLKQQCQACHAERSRPINLSAGHRAAVSVYHSDSYQLSGLSSSQACLLCHSRTSKLAATDGSSVSPPRFSEHASHPVGLTVVPGSGRGQNKIRASVDSRIPLFSGRIECQSCHDLTSRTSFQLRELGSYSQLCRGCHEHGRG